MTANQLRAEIDRFVCQIAEVGLALDSNITVAHPIGSGRTLIEWNNAQSLTDFDEAPSFTEYLDLIRRRQYTVLLFDYSFIQISYVIHYDQIAAHRMVYYPCPVVLDLEEVLELGLIDFIDLLEPNELVERLRQQTPLRFEYDPAAAKPGHPASHLHLSRPTCRIPVYAPLSLGRFLRFVFCHFYAREWERHDFLRTWKCDAQTFSIADSERRELHMACFEAAGT